MDNMVGDLQHPVNMITSMQQLKMAAHKSSVRSATHNVHDGQDVVLHSCAPMILHHFRVGHHQRFHPLLFAD